MYIHIVLPKTKEKMTRRGAKGINMDKNPSWQRNTKQD